MASSATQYRRVESAQFEQRAAPRPLVHLTRAKVRRRNSKQFEARLHDLSIYGCRVECETKQPEGERIWISIAGGMPIRATIVWCREGYVGCRFDAEISGATVRTLTRTHV